METQVVIRKVGNGFLVRGTDDNDTISESVFLNLEEVVASVSKYLNKIYSANGKPKDDE